MVGVEIVETVGGGGWGGGDAEAEFSVGVGAYGVEGAGRGEEEGVFVLGGYVGDFEGVHGGDGCIGLGRSVDGVN